MANNYTEIAVDEIPSLIDNLLNYFGQKKIKTSLQKYRKSLEYAKSSPLYKEYFLKNRHPWWEAIIQFNKLRKSQIQLRKPIPLSIELLAYDAKKILTLKKTMSKKVQQRYISAFFDDNSAKNYLFEIETAWIFYKKGWQIIWPEEPNKRKPEFIAQKDGVKIQVECKKISVDTSIKIRRSDFYKLTDLILPEITQAKLMGKLEIILTPGFMIDDEFLRNIAKQITTFLKKGELKCTETTDDLSVNMDLYPRANIIVNPIEIWNNFLRVKANGWHGVVLFSDYMGQTVDPIEISLKTEDTGDLLTTIYNTMKDAARFQINKNVPGFISCHLSEIPAFSGLERNSGLSAIAERLFLSEYAKHIVAVAFVSDMRIIESPFAQVSRSPGLFFKNENSSHPDVLDVNFLMN